MVLSSGIDLVDGTAGSTINHKDCCRERYAQSHYRQQIAASYFPDLIAAVERPEVVGLGPATIGPINKVHNASIPRIRSDMGTDLALKV